jgi:hypothetical protein
LRYKTHENQAIRRLNRPCCRVYFYIIKPINPNPQKNKAMKTTKILPVLAFAMIFGATFSASSATPYDPDRNVGWSPVINYRVNVHVPADLKLCNLYYVEIVDAHGRLAVPPKTFNPGLTVYNFYEKGPVTGNRAAVLVLADRHSHYICPTELYTSPAWMSGTFLNGQIYVFDLFPATTPGIDEANGNKD